MAAVLPFMKAETIEDTARIRGLTEFATDVAHLASIPNTAKIGVWRIEPSGHYTLAGLMEDPLVKTAAEQAKNN
jgi:hypothetical protein